MKGVRRGVSGPEREVVEEDHTVGSRVWTGLWGWSGGESCRHFCPGPCRWSLRKWRASRRRRLRWRTIRRWTLGGRSPTRPVRFWQTPVCLRFKYSVSLEFGSWWGPLGGFLLGGLNFLRSLVGGPQLEKLAFDGTYFSKVLHDCHPSSWFIYFC